LGKQETDPTLAEFMTAVAEATPTPAGGSVAALVGALAASLGVMGQRLGHHLDLTHALIRLSDRLHQLMHDDARTYRRLLDAHKTPKHDPGRQQTISEALHQATLIPLEIAESACEAGLAIHTVSSTAPQAVRGDLIVGIIMSVAAVEAGLHLARINIKEQSNHELTDLLRPRITKVEQSLEELKGLCYTPPPVT
jgi:glutamate formiminotransferase/glutamate formiminotransferase/formiminotetrahydrofolate cyclodeaminase